MATRWSLPLAVLVACAPSEPPIAPVVIPPSPPAASPEAAPAAANPPGPPPARPASTSPAAAEVRAPPADFTVYADIVKANKAAIGKIARLPVRRDHYTSARQFTAMQCNEPRGSNGSIWLRYGAEQRDTVRAMYGTPSDACAIASFEVVRVRPGPAPLVEGALVHVSGVTPKPPVPPPAGADYGALDDAILAGADAKGKSVAADMWAYNGDPKQLRVHDCHRSDSFVFVIPKTAAQEALARQLSTSPGRCALAHLVIADPDFVLGGNDGSMQRPRADVLSVP